MICAASASTVISRSVTNLVSTGSDSPPQARSSLSLTVARVGGASSATWTSRRNSRRANRCSAADRLPYTPSAVRVSASEIPPLDR